MRGDSDAFLARVALLAEQLQSAARDLMDEIDTQRQQMEETADDRTQRDDSSGGGRPADGGDQ